MSRFEASCLFCKIIQGTIPSHKILEGKGFYAFLDINPLSKGHTLVIPKYHTEKLHELPEEEANEIGPALVKIGKAIVSSLGVSDYNILQNNGAIAHQVVKHVHFHIIPKPNGQEGLGIHWPAKDTTKEDLKNLAESIKGKL